METLQKQGWTLLSSAVVRYQLQFRLDVTNLAFSCYLQFQFFNQHFFRAGRSMNSLPSQILERYMQWQKSTPMKIPTIEGIIERRVLVNFTVDPDIIQKIIPRPFQVKVYNSKAIVGICLIRLKHIRPKGFPAFLGISSENGAHRIAVEWTENNKIEQGVFIPRRDTSSLLNNFAGGRIFPGHHYYAKFDVKENNGNYHIAFKSTDGTTISIDGYKTDILNPNSIFENIENASNFFEGGGVGYSPDGDNYDGLHLKTYNWKVEPLNITSVQSSFFQNENVFQKGSVKFDNALLMTQIKHEWHSVGKKSHCM